MIKEAINKLLQHQDLTMPEMEAAMEEIMSGRLNTPEIVSFLASLDAKGETAQELAAAVEVMRKYAIKIRSRHKVILDTCGTGGDRKHTFNISTAVAFVASGAGIAVAKHGNRSVSSKSGSADVFEALGININMDKGQVEKCLDEIGITFLFAQNFHPAMKFAMAARKEIGAKTIFNFLGPLSNPAGATHQLVGVYDSLWARNLAFALKELGAKHALVVWGQDNLDEITTTAPSLIYDVTPEKVEKYEISYQDFGFKKAQPEDFSGGDARRNAEIIVDILNRKETGPQRDIVLLNAGAAIYAADATDAKDIRGGIKEGIEKARDSIDTGKALIKLELLKECSHK